VPFEPHPEAVEMHNSPSRSCSASGPACDLTSFDPNTLRQAADLTDELSCSAVRLLFHVAGLESCARGVCCAKGRTLAARMGLSDRTVRRRFSELVDAGVCLRVRRRCRTSWRGLTDLGRAVLTVLRAGGPLAVAAHLSAHKGEAQPKVHNSPSGSVVHEGLADPGPSVDPARYRRPRVAGCLSEPTWAALASWMRSARSVSWARCKMAHRAFSGLVRAVHRSSEWAAFGRAMAAKGRFVSAEDLLRLAVLDAAGRGRDFGTVETAVRYVSAVLVGCVGERRLPGERVAAGNHSRIR